MLELLATLHDPNNDGLDEHLAVLVDVLQCGKGEEKMDRREDTLNEDEVGEAWRTRSASSFLVAVPQGAKRTFMTSADSALTSDLIGALSSTLIFFDLKPAHPCPHLVSARFFP